MVLEDVKADAPVAVDVGVIDSSGELKLWRLERIILWEVDVQEEDSSLEGAVLRTHDGGSPMEEVFSGRAGAARSRGVILNIFELFVDPSDGHGVRCVSFFLGGGWWFYVSRRVFGVGS